LLKLDIHISERTVSRPLRRKRGLPSQTWKAFLANHLNQLVPIDFFTAPAATFRVLFVLVVPAHRRRGVIHFNVTEHPTAAWTAQQILEAFPEGTAPRYLIRDRGQPYVECFPNRLRDKAITEVLTALQSPWQNPFPERLVGSIRRECLDHMIGLGEKHLRRNLKSHFDYYLGSRTHLSLAKGAPATRVVQGPESGGWRSRRSAVSPIATDGALRNR